MVTFNSILFDFPVKRVRSEMPSSWAAIFLFRYIFRVLPDHLHFFVCQRQRLFHYLFSILDNLCPWRDGKSTDEASVACAAYSFRLFASLNILLMTPERLLQFAGKLVSPFCIKLYTNFLRSFMSLFIVKKDLVQNFSFWWIRFVFIFFYNRGNFTPS